ncbi:MAG: hypothetical protein IPG92_16615 [Flavobacteriales bacterium]|nr:hypothetical protein [Flavobacteriales bacterium]
MPFGLKRIHDTLQAMGNARSEFITTPKGAACSTGTGIRTRGRSWMKRNW